MQLDKTHTERVFLAKLDKHQGILHKICLVYSGGNLEKEDLYQEIVLQLWKYYPSFKGEAKFSTWLYRVALNTAIGLSKRPGFSLRMGSITPDLNTIENDIIHSEEIKILYKAISHLKKVEKAIILLWLEDKSYYEIADITGISVKNVSVRLVRIRAKLTGIIKKIYS